MSPLVSVVIPTWNRLPLLREAVASVRAQTFADYELIVADDGSTDGTGAWLAGRHITTVSLPHAGRPGLVRNRGAAAALGEWLAFLDSDDVWEPDKLERQVEFLRAHPALRLCHTRERWLRNGREISQAGQRHRHSGRLFRDSLKKCIIGPSTVMLSRSLFREHGGFAEDLEIAEDYEFWLRLTAREEAGYLDRPLTVKRGGHTDQLSAKYGHIEYFRIQALERALAHGDWAKEERSLILAELSSKCAIYARGAAKRGKDAESREFHRRQLHYAEEQRDGAG
jgi:glycosyltransferase involved in cell wall biosynthesis